MRSEIGDAAGRDRAKLRNSFLVQVGNVTVAFPLSSNKLGVFSGVRKDCPELIFTCLPLSSWAVWPETKDFPGTFARLHCHGNETAFLSFAGKSSTLTLILDFVISITRAETSQQLLFSCQVNRGILLHDAPSHVVFNSSFHKHMHENSAFCLASFLVSKLVHYECISEVTDHNIITLQRQIHTHERFFGMMSL